MSESAGYRIQAAEGEPGELLLRFSGSIGQQTVAAVLAEARAALEAAHCNRLVVDLGGVEFFDSAGALAVLQLQDRAEKSRLGFSLANVTESHAGLIDLIDPQALKREALIQERTYHGVVMRAGAATVHLVNDLIDTIAFIGQILAATADSLAHFRSIRWEEVRANIQKIGVDGLPIVGLLSFLMGFIIASMAANQLASANVNILIGEVVAIAMVQEFGPLITAIMVAGRTGSAFAAEIATMKVNEEVDAIAAMGYEPVRFLAVPRFLATMLVVPLLTLFADVLGALGGMVVAHATLNVSTYAYLTQFQVTLFSFVVASLKTVVFAFIIVTIGCQRGFRTRGGAEGVGVSTTSALVTSILMIIVADFAFASLVKYLG